VNEKGYIYFLLNPAMPGLVKIGFTAGELGDRLKQLSTSGVPQPFSLAAAFLVREPAKCEQEVHEALKVQRPNRDREFFSIALSKALGQAIPVILRFVSDEPSSASDVMPHAIEIDSTLSLTLQMLAHDWPEGTTPEQMVEFGQPEHPLDLRLRLIGLAEQGLVEEVGVGRSHKVWRLTNAGLKFMSAHGLLLRQLMDEKREGAQ
jgi:hypothetical protein